MNIQQQPFHPTKSFYYTGAANPSAFDKLSKFFAGIFTKKTKADPLPPPIISKKIDKPNKNLPKADPNPPKPTPVLTVAKPKIDPLPPQIQTKQELALKPLLPAKQEKTEEELKTVFTQLLRMNSFAEAERMSLNSAADESSKKIYQKAKKEFVKVAPFISRLTKPDELRDIRAAYTSTIKIKTEEDFLKEELEYAQFCRSQVDELTEMLREGRLELPVKKEFAQLPSSKTGSRRVAALTEKIGEIRSAKQSTRAILQKDKDGKDKALFFKTLREDARQYSTPAIRPYKWAAPLIQSVKSLSSAADMTHESSPYYDSTYALTYKGNVVNVVGISQKESRSFDDYLSYKGTVVHVVGISQKEDRWFHGYSSVSKTWQDIEDLFEKLMAFNIKKPESNKPDAIKTFQNQLNAFYANAAELVWLIGNTTPLERGSGTLAEWLLGIVHLQNGLEPPVLKTQFPQLDVLNITFPLSDYKKFFTYFFEPSTLPQHIKWPDLSSKPLVDQMEILYRREFSIPHIRG